MTDNNPRHNLGRRLLMSPGQILGLEEAPVYSRPGQARRRATASAARRAVRIAYLGPFSRALTLTSMSRSAVSSTVQPQSTAIRQKVKSARLVSGAAPAWFSGAPATQRS